MPEYTAVKRSGKTIRARVAPGPYQDVAIPKRSLDLADVLRLQALGTLGDIELDGVTLGEAAEALGLDRREVDEHVRTRLLRDKAEALRVVEPLHFTLGHTVLHLY